MTKRFLTIASLLLFIGVATRAQVRLGMEAGPNFARVLNLLQGYSGGGPAVYLNSKSITRLSAGFLADIPLDRKERFILRPSLLYFDAGGKTPAIQDFNGNQIAYAANWTFDYFQLPLQLLYSPSLSFGKPWIGAGFYGSTLISAQTKTSAGSNALNIGSASNDVIKRFDMGYTFTAGFRLKCGIFVGGDFQESLTGINSNPQPGTPAVRNSVWDVHLGYIASIRR